MKARLAEKLHRSETGGVDIAAMCRKATSDELALRTALSEAETVPQLMVYSQLSGDASLLARAAPFIEGGWSHMEKIPGDLRKEITEKLIDVLKKSASSVPPTSRPTPAMLSRLLSAGVNSLVPDDYAQMFMEEVDAECGRMRTAEWRNDPPSQRLEKFRVVVVGAGVAGLCMAIMLKKAGIAFEIIEKNGEVGGTWYENDYPGAGVDIPNSVYSFSFEPKRDWSRVFGKRDELLDYLKQLADKYELRKNIRFQTEVVGAEFNASDCCWNVTVRDSRGVVTTLTANVFVPAVGLLNRPSVPEIPGLESFKGPLFHTARWDHSVDVKGRRVAIVGTGASSLQVGPAIVDDVEKLLVFQRSPGWVGLNPSYHTVISQGMKWALERIPYFNMWYRFLLFWACGDTSHPLVQVDPDWEKPDLSLNKRNHQVRENMIRHMESELSGRPDLLAKVIPSYPPWGKRMLRDNNWFEMLRRDNVELINAGVKAIEPDALIDAYGNRLPVDVVVMATGFQATLMLSPMQIVGTGGATIDEVWKEEGARAYLGTSVPGFPNMFILGGPNTGLAHGGGVFFYAELQVRYIMQCLREMIEGNKATMECRRQPHDEYNRRVDEAHARMVWSHRGVTNWYRNAKGRVVAVCPWRLVDFWKLTYALNPDDYVFGDKQLS